MGVKELDVVRKVKVFYMTTKNGDPESYTLRET